MGPMPFRKDGIVMDDKESISIKVPVDRTYGHSRLGPALIASAYEHLIPIHRQVVSSEKKDLHRRKEQRPWAM
jgi:hypothetical protein